MDTKKAIVRVLVTTAAVAFINAPITSALAHSHKNDVPCYGVNSCKGKSSCKTASNSCKGQNACKGKGVKMMSAKKCEKLGGTTEEPKASS